MRRPPMLPADLALNAAPTRFDRAILYLALACGALGVAMSIWADAALHGGHKVGGAWVPASAAMLAIISGCLFLLVGEAFPRVAAGLIAFAVACLLAGSYLGLFVAPPEHYMGDVQRIMYVHVPTAWNALLAMTFAFGCAIASLFTSDFKWDARLEGGVEVGVLLAFLLCCQGAIWAKPTWGVWWDWDPRLTTTAVLLCAFIGILALRRFVDDPVKRATWSAVATIIAYVDVPIVYYSVQWWNSLHQSQSNPSTVSSQFYLPLRLNAFGVLFLMSGFIMLRARIASQRIATELAPPPSDFAGELA